MSKWKEMKSFFEVRRHFQNPWLILLLRFGIIKMPYFLHRITKDACRYAILARPSTPASAELFILREVLIWEGYADVLPLLPKQNIRLLDIGAHVGCFTLWLHRRLGVREAFCFEPETDSFRLLNFNLSLNECPMAKTIPCAVGGASRMAKFALDKSSHAGNSLYVENSAGVETKPVKVIALGEWLETIEGEFDLLKMDCEGAEWEILDRTNPRQFARFGALVAEIHGDPAQRRQVSEFKEMAEKVGFRTVRWDNKAHGLYIGVRR
jgi:FkbM family methyltransferase